jgi:4-diphosphocytidyl-2-C-methyl-D-erythritol kinase
LYDPGVISRRAYAKLNLALSVGPPLPPGDRHAGMHPIASWMHAIDLHDTIEVVPGPPGFHVEWAKDAPRPSPIDWPPEKDLSLRALRLLEREAGRSLAAALRVTKRIPVGGGLGGGSSDAAAAMLGISEALSLRIAMPRLVALLRELGSDVGFFLDESLADTPPRPALVAGLGDRIQRLPPASGWAVLIIPPFGCPTGPVYKAFDSLGPRPLRESDVARLARAQTPDSAALFNDLTPAAERVQPALRDLRERAARAASVPIHMSGSGSTLFALAPDRPAADHLRATLHAAIPDAALAIAQLI